MYFLFELISMWNERKNKNSCYLSYLLIYKFHDYWVNDHWSAVSMPLVFVYWTVFKLFTLQLNEMKRKRNFIENEILFVLSFWNRMKNRRGKKITLKHIHLHKILSKLIMHSFLPRLFRIIFFLFFTFRVTVLK